MVVMYAVPGLVVLVTGVLAVLSMAASRPANPGVHDGRLAECPDSPNCVCTFDTSDRHRIEPLVFEGDPAAAVDRLKTVVEAMPRSRIVTAEDGYLHAEFTSRLFRFTDDVEFLLDPAGGLIHFRSASRVGRSDLGVNRSRMEQIRQRYQTAASTR